MKLGACPRLALGPEVRVWYRALDPAFARNPLSAVHTKATPSRFSPGPGAVRPFEVLHFSEDQTTALYEVEALFGSLSQRTLVPNPIGAWLIIDVQVQLQQVADLSLVSQQTLLATNAQELTGDWDGYRLRTSKTSISEPTGTAPTQNLGEALADLPLIEGFRTVSAKVPYQKNLVVFPEKLLPGSRLVFLDRVTGKKHVLSKKHP